MGDDPTLVTTRPSTWELFTDGARRVIHLADKEARFLKHNQIGTEHILIGLIQEGEGVAAKALEQRGISLEAVRTQVEVIMGRGVSSPSAIPLSARAKKAIELSLREALRLGHSYLGTEHLLLGLVHEGEGVASQVLVGLGADLSRVREQVHQILDGNLGSQAPSVGDDLQSHEGARVNVEDAIRGPDANTEDAIEGTRVSIEESLHRGTMPLPGYMPDTSEGEDRLGFLGDVEVLSLLIAAREVEPPLSVGLFGDWGSGKSFFLKQLETRIGKLATSGHPAYCKRIRQIRFNAWHYTDSDLWASLVSHLFDELRNDQQAWSELAASLEAEVTDRPRLGNEIAASRREVEKYERRLNSLGSVGPRSARAVAALAEHESVQPSAVTPASAGLAELQGMLGVSRPTINQLSQWGRGVRFVLGRPMQLLRLFRTSRRLVVLLLVLLVAVVGSTTLALTGHLPGLLPIGTAVIGGIAAAVGIVDRAWAATKSARTVLEALSEAEQCERNRLASELEQARSRLSELERARDAIGIAGRWRQLVASANESAAYRSRLGVVDQIRRDLEHMAHLMRAKGADAPVERIILYVDDLDRCPSHRVVEVLEAIHLLLALPLFVVVVAVDQRWLERSLRAHYAVLLEAEEAPKSKVSDWAATPQRYLEKIFQIPYAVPCMSEGSFRSLVESLLPVTNEGGELGVPDTRLSGEPTLYGDDFIFPIEDAVIGITEVSMLEPEALRVTGEERRFLAILGPLIATPRAAKRLTNTYRLIRVAQRGDTLGIFLKDGEYRAVAMLLAVVAGQPDSGVELLAAIADASPPEQLDEVVERSVPNLSSSLKRVAVLGSEAKLPLPKQIVVYQRWVATVSRFSFRISGLTSSEKKTTG